jgi:hypothetical protein
MFISNHVSKFIIPTALAVILATLVQWLTGDTKYVSARQGLMTKSNSIATAGSPKTMRPVGYTSVSGVALDPSGATIAADKPSRNWVSYWREKRANWRRRREELRSGNNRYEWPLNHTSALPSLWQDATYETESRLDPMLELFATPDSPGSIAIGAAEGTRKSTGETTERYWGHPDPANGVINLGTFSYQHEASNAQDADRLQLVRIREQIRQVQKQARVYGVPLSPLELVVAADLLNQSPEAGESFVKNLMRSRDRGLFGVDALLDARMQSFVNPETSAIDAGGFDNNWLDLKKDQMRRLHELQKALEVQGVI